MITRKNFADRFVFGVAASAYQIEGHSFGGAGKTIWDTFAAQPGNVANEETGAVACDHYHHYEQDLDFLQGMNAYRFSTSWARILPEGRGQINQAGLDFYDRLVDAILDRNLAPYLTLYHWDMPAALGTLGGWTNRDVAQWFGDYTDIVMDRIGDRVISVATINEPWCVSWLSYFLGHHAPGLKDIGAAARAVHHVLLSHSEAMARLRERGQENLGIVLNFEAVNPASDSSGDCAAAARFDATMNRMFLEPVISGNYPQLVLEGIAPHLPKNWEQDMSGISVPLDWLGVNYYTRKTIADAPGSWPRFAMKETDAPKTQMGWDIYPEGLGEILGWLHSEFTHGLPLFVTENGMAWPDVQVDFGTKDNERIRFLFQHLEQVKTANSNGGNVQGYFYWSLFDNYEWALGYEKRFGLIHVDFETMIRTPKDSYYAFKKWLSE